MAGYRACICAASGSPQALTFDAVQKRVSLYLSKIDQAANKQELQNAKQTLEIDVGAANRFITSAIPELTVEQRQKLKEVMRKIPFMLASAVALLAARIWSQSRLQHCN